MRLCIKCWYISSGDFCGLCARPLGVNRCLQGHTSSLWSSGPYCTVCRQQMMPGVPCLSLHWLARLTTLVFVVVAVRIAVQQHGMLLCLTWKTTTWLLAFVLSSSPTNVQQGIRQIFAWTFMLWLFSYFLPNGNGRIVRRTLWQGIQMGGRFLRNLLGFLKKV